MIWNVDPEIFSLGPLHIRWYGLMFLIGFLLSLKIFKKICKIENKPIHYADELLNHVFMGTLIGARLGHCFFYEPIYYMSHPLEIFAIWNGGLASHGGGLGVFIAVWIFSKKHPDLKIMWLFDRVSPLVAMTGSLIRIGNLLNSEILGKPSQVPWAIIFQKVDAIPRHPTQIYESLSYLLTAILGGWVYKKYQHKPPEGLMLGSVIGLIFTFRFIWEFFKENQEPFESNMILNMGQILSLPFIFAGIFLVLRAFKNTNTIRSNN